MVEFSGLGPIAGVRLAHQVAPLPRAQPPDMVAGPAGASTAGADLLDQRGAPGSGHGAGQHNSKRDDGGGASASFGRAGSGARASGTGAPRTGAFGMGTSCTGAFGTGAQGPRGAAGPGGPPVSTADPPAVPISDDTPTGPPPAFTTTPLDAATDLRLALARLQAGYDTTQTRATTRAGLWPETGPQQAGGPPSAADDNRTRVFLHPGRSAPHEPGTAGPQGAVGANQPQPPRDRPDHPGATLRRDGIATGETDAEATGG